MFSVNSLLQDTGLLLSVGEYLRDNLPVTPVLPPLIKSYENNGTVVVSRYADVIEVLNRDPDFETVFGPRMEILTGGPNFFLGMPNDATFQRDLSNMRAIVRFSDIEWLRKQASAISMAALAQAGKSINVEEFAGITVATLLLDYFGIKTITPTVLLEATALMFQYLFTDVSADPVLDKQAVAAAMEINALVDQAIADRNKNPSAVDDVLDRAMALQGTPGMDPITLRNNIIGVITGAVPSIAQASENIALQLILPKVADQARIAAAHCDDAGWLGYVMEGWRFNPIDVIMYRRAVADTTLAGSAIPKGTMVILFTLSAMFDPAKVINPNQFVGDRPMDNFLFFGHGVHECFGEQITKAVMPAILRPLIATSGLTLT